MRTVRRFFDRRGVFEVDTPALAAGGVTDVNLEGLSVAYDGPGAPASGWLWLQTSPEYAMKRLLAAGSGSIYQITHAYRAAERGWLHNPEFSLLEWYRVGFDHHALMDEVAALVTELVGERPVEWLTYGGAMRRYAGIDPFGVSRHDLRAAAVALAGQLPALDRDGLLDLILSHAVAPRLGSGVLTFMTDFPASQAALARIRPGEPPVAERFELFVEGVEIANGFHELADPAEQRRRFEADRSQRASRGAPQPDVDERFLAALATGLPDCAGVALGLDRLIMLALGETSIDCVMAFPVERA